jgi:hypothetical protein
MAGSVPTDRGSSVIYWQDSYGMYGGSVHMCMFRVYVTYWGLTLTWARCLYLHDAFIQLFI